MFHKRRSQGFPENLGDAYAGGKQGPGPVSNLTQLIQETIPSRLDLSASHALFGLGFGAEGVPIDVLVPLLAGKLFRNFTVLITDEFLRLNDLSEAAIKIGEERLLKTLGKLEEIFSIGADCVFASQLMCGCEYRDLFQYLQRNLSAEDTAHLQSTIPARHRDTIGPSVYPLHEVAITIFLAQRISASVKLGPSREKLYDHSIDSIAPQIDFAYTIDSFAVGTKEARTVVPYLPGDKGSGERIYFHDKPAVVDKKLRKVSPQARSYLTQLSQISAAQLGITLEESSLSLEEMLHKAVLDPFQARI